MFSKWKYLFYTYDSIYAIKKQIKNEGRKQNLNEKNIKLVIAKKPLVALSIAKVIGADKREDRQQCQEGVYSKISSTMSD